MVVFIDWRTEWYLGCLLKRSPVKVILVYPSYHQRQTLDVSLLFSMFVLCLLVSVFQFLSFLVFVRVSFFRAKNCVDRTVFGSRDRTEKFGLVGIY